MQKEKKSMELGNGTNVALKKRSELMPLHIEDFTRARINESDLTATAVLVEPGAMPVPTKS